MDLSTISKFVGSWNISWLARVFLFLFRDGKRSLVSFYKFHINKVKELLALKAKERSSQLVVSMD
jgi:hypothetical protein